MQKSLIALDQEVAGAIATSLRHVTVQHMLAGVRGSDAAVLPTGGKDAR